MFSSKKDSLKVKLWCFIIGVFLIIGMVLYLNINNEKVGFTNSDSNVIPKDNNSLVVSTDTPTDAPTANEITSSFVNEAFINKFGIMIENSRFVGINGYESDMAKGDLFLVLGIKDNLYRIVLLGTDAPAPVGYMTPESVSFDEALFSNGNQGSVNGADIFDEPDGKAWGKSYGTGNILSRANGWCEMDFPGSGSSGWVKESEVSYEWSLSDDERAYNYFADENYIGKTGYLKDGYSSYNITNSDGDDIELQPGDAFQVIGVDDINYHYYKIAFLSSDLPTSTGHIACWAISFEPIEAVTEN